MCFWQKRVLIWDKRFVFPVILQFTWKCKNDQTWRYFLIFFLNQISILWQFLNAMLNVSNVAICWVAKNKKSYTYKTNFNFPKHQLKLCKNYSKIYCSCGHRYEGLKLLTRQLRGAITHFYCNFCIVFMIS